VSYYIAALYHFAPLPQFRDVQPMLHALAESNQVLGTLLLAEEGVNGTIAGPQAGVEEVIAFLRALPGFEGLGAKFAHADSPPFRRLKVRLKKEIVTMGAAGADPTEAVGTYVRPADWNELISRPDVVLIDTRNDYEVEIGTFKGAIDPVTDSFREFPQWLKDQNISKDTPVAMFCTGGIRCERATAWMRSQGYEQVFHLKGGILQYLDDVEKQDSMWEGECFVFDDRVAVDHDLKPGSSELCFGCRWPVNDEDRTAETYEPGVCCPRCIDTLTPAQLAGRRERHRQTLLARSRGQEHLARHQ